MALTQDQQRVVNYVIKEVKKYSDNLTHNKKLFQIYEGNLLPQVLDDLAQELSPESYAAICGRVAPINILKRTVDKLSTIYAKPIKRTVINGTPQDEELLHWYEEQMDINAVMNGTNELFNLHKCTVFEPYVDEMKPRLRSVPSDRSLMLSDNTVDPTRPTIWVKLMGTCDYQGREKTVLYIYTNDYFIPVTEDGDLLTEVLAQNENPEGINPIGQLTGTYVNQSRFSIVPTIDSDMLRMTKIIPVILSDLNFAAKFQCFSIIYTIDAETSNARYSPNALWNLKSDATSEKKPEIGFIKPTADIQQILSLVQAELTFWLNSKNIRPGTIGGLSAENFASGISKAIDEMDTVEARQKQVPEFMRAERKFWELITKKLHPYWMKNKMIDQTLMFSPNCEIKIEFPEQLPMSDRESVLNNLKLELELKLTTRERAIKTLNPEMSDAQVEELMADIDEQNTVEIQVPHDQPQQDQVINDQMDMSTDGQDKTLPI